MVYSTYRNSAEQRKPGVFRFDYQISAFYIEAGTG